MQSGETLHSLAYLERIDQIFLTTSRRDPCSKMFSRQPSRTLECIQQQKYVTVDFH